MNLEQVLVDMRNIFGANELEPYNGTVLSLSCRGYGQWELPEGVEDEEDFDFEIPTQDTVNEVDRLIKLIEIQHNIVINYSFEEKNYIDFEICDE